MNTRYFRRLQVTDSVKPRAETLKAQNPLPISLIQPPEGWASLGLKEPWDYRELLYFLTWRDIKVRYKQTVLGAAWTIIQPVFMVVVFTLFFGHLAGVPSDGVPYPVFVFCGLLPWQLFAHALSESSKKRCLDRMGELAKEGRTVLFVSHNMVAVQSLCERAVWLHQGEIAEDGVAGTVVSNYLNKSYAGTGLTEELWPDNATAPGNDLVRLHALRLKPQSEYSSEPLTMKTPLSIEVEYWNLLPEAQLNMTLHVYTENGIIAFSTGSGNDPDWQGRRLPAGLFRSVCFVPGDLLNAGAHRFVVLVVRDRASVIYHYDSAISFEILDLQERAPGYYGREPGVVQPALNWTTEYLAERQPR